MHTYDIAILGAGPAGSTLARLLGSQMDVVLIDKKNAQPDSFQKPCGGLLSPDAQKALSRYQLTLPKEILVDPQIFSVKTIDLKTDIVRHYQRFYINLDRHKFDLWMASLVPDRVTRAVGRCSSIEKKDGLFVLTVRQSTEEEIAFRAQRVVGADGANSLVRRTFYPHERLRPYVAIQQWFPETHRRPFYSCLFDPETSDCCSWSISKDNWFIFGGAFAPQNCRVSFERQKEKLHKYGFRFGTPLKTEACLVLRPRSPWDFCCGEDGVFLIGEAAGFISPSSLEGISFAIHSAQLLADILLSSTKEENRAYKRRTLPMRLRLIAKMAKCLFLYQPFLRRLVMKSGLKAIDLQPEP